MIDTRRHDAVIFDLDGVVTDSASIHAAAWTELFDAFLAQRAPSAAEDHSPFTAADYQRFVDGKPRYDGVADFLASRAISLPHGEPTDAPGTLTVCGLGNRKDELFLAHIARTGVPVFASTVALVRQLRAAGLGVAIFSASRHCAEVLTAAGAADLFPVRVDGIVADELGLPGKPDPAMLAEAARRLGADPERTVVVEDAEAGVAAGHRGGFGLVIGVDRVGHGRRLRAGGADVVVGDLADVAVLAGFRRMSEVPDALTSWLAVEDRLESEKTAVLLDFDGTLVDIVADPSAAVPAGGVGAILARLAEQCPVAILSGRDLDDVRTRVGVPGLWYAGSHGFELVAPDGSRHTHDAGPSAEQALARAATELDGRLRAVPGVLVEHKRFAVAVHHRNVLAEAVPGVVSAVHDIARQEGLRVTTGRKVTELRPDVEWDKGRAVQWIMERLGDPAVPIYVGDDLTDEDAFDAVAAAGLAIVVRHNENGDRRTAAHFAVDGPVRVHELLSRLADRLSCECGSIPWLVTYDGYDPAAEKKREALCTVGNGYLATRGAAPESRAGARHYPGTYLAGVYNRLTDAVAGRTIDNESLVNVPNWLPVTWRLADGDWFDLDAAELLDYRQQLDLRRAVLSRTLRYRDAAGRLTSITQDRFAAMHEPHACALRTTIVAENWSGRLTVRSTIDAAVRNSLVDRYRGLSDHHLTPITARPVGSDAVVVLVQTSRSRIPIATAARTVVRQGGEKAVAASELVDSQGSFGHDIDLEVTAGEPVEVEKTAVLFTGRDHAVSAPDESAERLLDDLGDFEELRTAHTRAWDRLWSRLSIDLQGSDHALRVLRLHLLHLVQTLSPHTSDLDAGVPARGLHGEAYRGHVFWDELFVFPVLNLRFPELSRALLRYRHRRLPEARRAARRIGCAGALFPWQSGGDGREESQQLHLNPRSGHWNPDPSARARHGGLALAYNVWQYYQATRDGEFLAEYGAELLVEIARFCSGSAEYDPADDRYHIRGVIGPDEFHSGYPGAPYGGVDDNAYTNIMAAWTLRHAVAGLQVLAPRVRAELLDTLGVAPSETTRWAEIADRIFVPFHDGVLSQFARYDELAELDWAHYRGRYGDIQRLDRILEAEGDDVNRYRVAKQADVLMLFYLLSVDELRELLGRAGYELPGDMVQRTVDYYLARTSHGSTLSAVVHAWVLARANRDRALEFFGNVLESDIADIQGGTTAEGIHLGAMAGSIDLVQRCFTGLEIRGDRLIFAPRWPKTLGTLVFPIIYRSHRLTVRIDTTAVEVSSDADGALPIEIECRGGIARLATGHTVWLPVDPE
ncbi:trehalose-phosphatase [Nocardia mexicana]|uniref:trehalose-phosphatase n=1 Tax=Nocardia mexicana TaxID=279262 RepID=UPI0020D2635E|nr:trehalose-phosphatase [Nocardia mexicana]